MTANHSSRMLRRLAACTLAGAILLAIPSVASARMSRPTILGDQQCWGLQNRWDQLALDLEHASKYGTEAQYQGVLSEMHSVISDWNYLCRGEYGSIIAMTRADMGLDAVGGQAGSLDQGKAPSGVVVAPMTRKAAASRG